MKRIAVAQLGGPTTVINATLEGIITAGMKADSLQVYGFHNGIEGLIKCEYTILDDSIKGIKNIPGAFLGAGRIPANKDNIAAAINNLLKLKIEGLLLIGGNGTMWTCNEFNKEFIKRGLPIKIIGVPKTVDNDLRFTDYSPGFPSAATFVSQAIRDIGLDLKSMKNFEQVRLLEIMGRNVGWLTAASVLQKKEKSDPPHIVLLPEYPVDVDKFICKVKEVYDDLGYVVVAVSEGVVSTCGIVKGGIKLGIDGPIIPGGVAEQLSNILISRTKLITRGERLGLLQRSSSLAVSKKDQSRSLELGEFAVQALLNKKSGVMITIQREKNSIGFSEYPLEYIGGKERKLPEKYYNEDFTIKNEYVKWLKPLI